MSAENGYRKRSRDVRVAARSHLVALRAARRNRAGSPAVDDAVTVLREAEPAVGPDDFQPDAEMVAAAEAASSAGSGERGPEAGCVAGEREPPTVVEIETERAETAPGDELVPPGFLAPADEPGPAHPVAEAAPAPAGPETIGAEPAATAVIPASGPAPEPAPEPECPDEVPSDLFDLPGAGSGLVWMLRQCGIHALEDLAEADATQLRRSLGLVGELLDVAGWIAFAQERAAATGPDRGDA